MTPLPPAALAAAEEIDCGAMRPREIIALHATDPEAAFTAAMTRIERLEGFLRSDDTSLETKERIYAQARRDIAKHHPAPAEAQEAVEARLERIRVRWSQAGLTSFSQDHADVAWLLSLVRPPVAVPDGREKEIRSLLAMCDAGYNVAPVLIVEAAADLLRLLDAERERVRKEER
jgi:hypothetical protein